MKLYLLASAVLAFASPATAQTVDPPAPVVLIPAEPIPAMEAPVYGPPAPEPPRSYTTEDGREPYTAAQIAEADAKWKRDTQSAWKWFAAAQGLAVADGVITCIALAQRNPDGSKKFKEVNPVLGGSCGTVIPIKLGIGLIQFLIARKGIRENPGRSKKTLRVSAGFNVALVGYSLGTILSH